MSKLLTLISLLFTFFIPYGQTMEEGGQTRAADRKEWFNTQNHTQRENYKFFDADKRISEGTIDTFQIFDGAIYADNLKAFIERANIQGGHLIKEMIKEEETLRDSHTDLASKDNFAQFRFLALYQNSGLDSFSIPLYAEQGEADAFYANGNLGSIIPGFSQPVNGYPWFSKSNDNSIILVQRPSSTPEATEKTVELLQNLTHGPNCPSTISAEKLEYLHRRFKDFKDEQASIKEKLRESLTGYLSTLKEEKTVNKRGKGGKRRKQDIGTAEGEQEEAYLSEVFANNIAIFKNCIDQMRFDLEGRFFEIEKKNREMNSKEQVDNYVRTHHPDLLESFKSFQEEFAKIKEDISRLKQELKTNSDNREELQQRLNTYEEERKRVSKEITKLANVKKEIETPLVKEQRVISNIYEYLRKKYLELIAGYKDICSPKDFNFGCSEQLLVDHLFRVNVDETVVCVTDKINGKILDTLVLLIHSTMTPCKTCSLAIALEAIHDQGRIFNFFRLIKEDIERDFKGIVVVSFSKEYGPTNADKFYGFAFKWHDPLPPTQDFYWLVNCPPAAIIS